MPRMPGSWSPSVRRLKPPNHFTVARHLGGSSRPQGLLPLLSNYRKRAENRARNADAVLIHPPRAAILCGRPSRCCRLRASAIGRATRAQQTTAHHRRPFGRFQESKRTSAPLARHCDHRVACLPFRWCPCAVKVGKRPVASLPLISTASVFLPFVTSVSDPPSPPWRSGLTRATGSSASTRSA